VYQELQRHGLAGGEGLCLLLTGRSFQHHFSAAVSLGIDQGQTESLVADFDVADRCRAPVATLAATYLVELDSGSLADAEPSRIAWSPDRLGPGSLELLVEPPATLALAEAGRGRTSVQVLAAIKPGALTHRLRYRWHWTSVSDRTR
jgi:hypothetical protein